MLFNSQEFLFAFLPVTVIGFYLIALTKQSTAMKLWLLAASAYFYWQGGHAWLLAVLAAFNYLVGYWILQSDPGFRRSMATGVAICANIAVLLWFKYSGFFVRNIEAAAGISLAFTAPLLPLAISFFTFQKIAYIADISRGVISRIPPASFALFVFFFPQLIAGPIVHFREIAPQFSASRWSKAVIALAPAGVVFFSIGLAKKVVVADSLASYVVNPYFGFVDAGGTLDLWRSWLAALAYTAQLYFDFSGYSDMAIGLALLFGISLPINFFSPYKASSIIDFWRRWHITLSRFLMDYLYIPLGGNRKGPARRYINLMIVMLVGGFWHGAEWTFLAWGGLHGLYLCINHGFRRIFPVDNSRRRKVLGVAITFIAVVVAWVLFRATSFASALIILQGMVGLHGTIDGAAMAGQASRSLLGGPEVLLADQMIASVMVVMALGFCFVAPNLIQITRYVPPSEENANQVPKALALPVALYAWSGLCLGAALWFILAGQPSDFIYFRF